MRAACWIVCWWVLVTQALLAREPEPVVGGPCDGCEAVFDGLPEQLSAQARIAAESEPGEPMRITGRVWTAAGEPAVDVPGYAACGPQG